MRALSIRQPWAELILRGIKTIEVRSRLTRVRGRVYIYASLGRIESEEEARVSRDHGSDVDGCSRGVIVGTVEIVGFHPLRLSDSARAGFQITDTTELYGWDLESAERAETLIKPEKHPQPVFFNPF